MSDGEDCSYKCDDWLRQFLELKQLKQVNQRCRQRAAAFDVTVCRLFDVPPQETIQLDTCTQPTNREEEEEQHWMISLLSTTV